MRRCYERGADGRTKADVRIYIDGKAGDASDDHIGFELNFGMKITSFIQSAGGE